MRVRFFYYYSCAYAPFGATPLHGMPLHLTQHTNDVHTEFTRIVVTQKATKDLNEVGKQRKKRQKHTQRQVQVKCKHKYI